MDDDFTFLTQSGHWLGWLGDDPAQAVRDGIEEMLQKQVPTATLEWVRLLASPEFLTGGREERLSPNMILVKRAALAVPFELQVASQNRKDLLRGVFSWVATGLDSNRSDRTFLDLDQELEWASEMLKIRIYDLDEPEPPSAEPQSPTGRWWEFWRKSP